MVFFQDKKSFWIEDKMGDITNDVVYHMAIEIPHFLLLTNSTELIFI